MDQQVTLGYWKIRGLSERIRHILQYCEIPYNEDKYEGAEGRAKWNEIVKPELIKKNAAITLPYLIDGDRVISETDAICVYLCHKSKKLHLLGRNAEEQVSMATVHGVFKDVHGLYIRLAYGMSGHASFEEGLKKSADSIEGYLNKFAGILGTKEFICGEITWVDFEVADFVQTLTLMEPALLENLPTLLEYQKRVWGIPKIKEYLSSNRFNERPCNNSNALWK